MTITGVITNQQTLKYIFGAFPNVFFSIAEKLFKPRSSRDQVRESERNKKLFDKHEYYSSIYLLYLSLSIYLKHVAVLPSIQLMAAISSTAMTSTETAVV